MNDQSIRDSFSEDDRAKFERGAELLTRVQKGAHFDDWIVIGQGLIPVRDAIIKLYRFKKTRGQLYSKAFSDACKRTPYAHLDSDERSNLLYCIDNLATIEKMRAEWPPDERARVCHPDTMRKRLREYAGDPQASNSKGQELEKVSPYRKLQTELEDALRREAILKRQQDDGGNLWKANDMARDIAAFLYPHFAKMSEKKCREVLKVLTDKLNADWNKEKSKRKASARHDTERPEAG